MTTPIKFNASFSSSNYLDFGERIESLNTINTSLQTGKITTSIGVGVDTKGEIASIFHEYNNELALEAKLKYNINDNLNAQARFRKIGSTEQYRIAFGGSYKINDNNLAYSSLHLTTKNSNKEWSTNTGAWLGFTHNFKKCSLSVEYQQNFPLDIEKNSFKFDKIQSSDSMLNFMLSVPF